MLAVPGMGRREIIHMRHMSAALALSCLFLVAACDQKEEETAAGEDATAGIVTSDVIDDGNPAGDEMQTEFQRAEAGCRAAAEALAIWVARPWADAKETVTGGNVATIRIIRPGDMVTKDYRTDRLNVELDDNDVVTRVYCG